MDWMLSDEEMDKICHEFIDISLFEGDSRAFSKALLKAQARRLVEWLDQPCENSDHLYSTIRLRCSCFDCMLTLRKEVGLEE